MRFINLDESPAFVDLQQRPLPEVAAGLTLDNIKKYDVEVGAGLRFNYAGRGVDDGLLAVLQRLAEQQQVIEKYRSLLGGALLNTSEQRAVLHHLLRAPAAGEIMVDGKNIGEFYQQQLQRLADFVQRVHSGQLLGASGKPFSRVVQIGIGGSDLGPRALYLSLEKRYELKMRGGFIANVDPDDAAAELAAVNLEETLFILVSKSGTTQETLSNEYFVRNYFKEKKLDSSKHIVAVTSSSSPLANNADYLDCFYIDDYIGGRYSSCSAVGGVLLSLAFGYPVFEQLLDGAHQADCLALNSDIRANAALMDALLGVVERNIRNLPVTAILPYSQALIRFPAHLQQLDMESNGKRVNRDGVALDYQTGPIVFGEPGTNGQHSFYQLLHQGTAVVPLQFIGFGRSQLGVDAVFNGWNSQAKLIANLVAQIFAFAVGNCTGNDANKHFPGGRPSSLIYGAELNARSLGALLAHYENKVMFQGFLWNINSFDQEGVQLGKILTGEILQGNGSAAMKLLFSLISNGGE